MRLKHLNCSSARYVVATIRTVRASLTSATTRLRTVACTPTLPIVSYISPVYYFNSQSNINADGFRSLREGEPVEYDLEAGEDGRAKAINVTGPSGSPPQVSKTCTIFHVNSFLGILPSLAPDISHVIIFIIITISLTPCKFRNLFSRELYLNRLSRQAGEEEEV